MFFSSSSLNLETFATDAIESSSFNLIILTPCVALPISLKLSTPILIVIPDLFITIKSSSSVTFFRDINLPVFSVIFIVLTPFPPLFVILYCSIDDLFPYPFSATTKILDSKSFTQTIPTTSSSLSLRLIPLTPEAVLPIDLTFSSSNLIHFPE